jgi:FKBP-type peptidyl-prolyl cis-trans isomerase
MKKQVLAFLLVTALLSGCAKKDEGCTPQAASVEKSAMVSFCTSNSISYTEHSSGMLYNIVTPGTGPTPTLTSRVFIYYTGKLLNGTQFDSQSDPTKTGWVLNSLIDGWKVGLPLIKQGGRIQLVIPSYMAYGCTGSGPIPPNSPLFFDITITLVQ